jgi:hypothetical protein
MADRKADTKASQAPQRVRVRATQLGWYGNKRRREGDVFDIVLAPGQKMPSWVVKTGDKSAAVKLAGEAGSPNPDDETGDAGDGSPL